MRRWVRCGVRLAAIVLVGCAVVWGGSPPVAASGETWVGKALQVYAQKDASHWIQPTFCAGDDRKITVNGSAQLVRACVFGEGEGVRLARYSGASGSWVYAVMLPLDTEFIPLHNFCNGMSWCVYGQGEDTALLQSATHYGSRTILIKDFTKYLMKSYEQGRPLYRFEYTGEWNFISAGAQEVRTGAIGVSKNGRWAIVEAMGYGFVRVDLQTLAYRRVTAPGGSYGYGFNPGYEIGVSNDGIRVAVGGNNVGFSIFEVDASCGDVLTESSGPTFSDYTFHCPSVSVDAPALFPGYASVYTPRFSSQGSRLTLYVSSPDWMRSITIGPRLGDEHTGNPLYIAFGDSFTSGEGETDDAYYLPGTNTSENRCHVSSRSYPYLLMRAWEVQGESLACSGAKVNNVREASLRYQAQRGRNDMPSIVSVGVGGNDIGIMGKLKSCLTPGTCEWAKPDRRLASVREIRRMFDVMVELITTLKQEYTNASVVVVGYPSVVNTLSSAKCSVIVNTLLSADERQYLDETVRLLNQMLRTAAHYTATPYINIEESLNGERLCDPVEASMNAVRLGDDIAPLAFLKQWKLIGAESFHPTPRGHERIAQAIVAQDEHLWSAGGQFDESQLYNISSYWREQAPGSGDANTPKAPIIDQIAKKFIAIDTIIPKQPVPFSFIPGSFIPGSTVRLELHSDPVELGVFTVGDDGSLSGTVTIPEGVEGYHTLHAYSASSAGEETDIYQEVTVTQPDSSGGEGVTAGGADKGEQTGTPAPRIHRVKPASIASGPGILNPTLANREVALHTPEQAERSVLGSKSTQETQPAPLPLSARMVWWCIGGIIGVISVVAAIVAAAVARRRKALDINSSPR